MTLTMSIKTDALAEEQLDALSRELCDTLNSETAVKAQIPDTSETQSESAHETGSRDKGDPITIGTIVLAAFTSGAVVAFCNVLKSYFDRTNGMKISISDVGGNTVEIESTNLDPDHVNETIDRVRAIISKD